MKFHLYFSGFWEDEAKMASITERLTNLLRERREGLWLTYAEDEDVFLPGSVAADTLGEALFVDRGVDFEVVQLAQQAHWPFSVSW